MAQVNDAVILAGGRGTRMLPASLYVPKETLPLVDTPIINHLIWEAARAGVKNIHLVLSERKKSVLEKFLENGSIHGDDVRTDLPRESLAFGVSGVRIIPHIQYSQGGVADAISVAIGQIKGPFLVLLGDMVILDSHLGPRDLGVANASIASRRLVSEFEKNGVPNVGIYPVDSSEISNYGVVSLDDGMVVGLREKPKFSESPKEYVLSGRYIFPENTMDIMDYYPVSEFGEMQSIRLLDHFIENGGLQAVKFDNMEMYDSGEPLIWLKSQIDHALKREDLNEGLVDWINRRIMK